jgi:hypothetical protein
MSKGRHVFDVLRNHFEKSAARHVRFGNRAKAASDHLRKCFTKAEMDEDDNPYSGICDLLDELVGEYADAAASDIESCKECMKADTGDLEKIPGITPVPRYGQRDLATAVDPQFAKIVAVDEDEPNMRNLHL